MENYIIHIKNMVCRRCVMTVEDILRSLDITDAEVSLGSVAIPKMPDNDTMLLLEERLNAVGFELIKSNESVILEKVKALIRNYARNPDLHSIKLSSYIQDSMNMDFRYISKLFSSIESRTIQKYLMRQRIEFVKELLLDDKLTLAEIADAAGFSSVAHISAAFKKSEGINISDFKSSGHRTPLDEI